MNLFQKLGLVEADEELEDVGQETTEDSKEAAPVAAAPASQQGSTMKFSMPQQPVATPGQIIGKIDNDVYAMLSEAVEKNNLEGNDFLEFMQSLNAMSGMAVDESTKFNMVFATLSTAAGGLDKTTLLTSIQHYLSVIENEKNIFSGEMEDATTSMVTANIDEATRLTQLAEHKAEQIKILQEEILQINENVGQLSAAAQESEIKIAQKQADFDVTVGQLIGQLTAYESKINQYIQ